MKKPIVLRLIALLFAAWLAAVLPGLATAQNEGLSLRISKIIGFNNFTNSQIQGTFSLQASGPGDLAKVTFFIDGNPMGQATQSPYKITFNTGSYSLGAHTLSALGTTSGGQELKSNDLQINILSPQASSSTAFKIIIPILIIVGVAAVLSAVFPWLMRGGKNEDLPLGAPRNYGISGGAICPRCKRPYARHAFSLNMGIGAKLDRCPYCGKWAVVRRRSLEELRAAEAAELLQVGGAGAVPEESEEEKLRKEIDKSRYL